MVSQVGNNGLCVDTITEIRANSKSSLELLPLLKLLDVAAVYKVHVSLHKVKVCVANNLNIFDPQTEGEAIEIN